MMKRNLLVAIGALTTGCGDEKKETREQLITIIEEALAAGNNINVVADGFTDEEVEEMIQEAKRRLEAGD